MTKTLENMTIEELKAAWDVAYDLYQSFPLLAAQQNLDAIAAAMAKKLGA